MLTEVLKLRTVLKLTENRETKKDAPCFVCHMIADVLQVL